MRRERSLRAHFMHNRRRMSDRVPVLFRAVFSPDLFGRLSLQFGFLCVPRLPHSARHVPTASAHPQPPLGEGFSYPPSEVISTASSGGDVVREGAEKTQGTDTHLCRIAVSGMFLCMADIKLPVVALSVAVLVFGCSASRCSGRQSASETPVTEPSSSAGETMACDGETIELPVVPSPIAARTGHLLLGVSRTSVVVGNRVVASRERLSADSDGGSALRAALQAELERIEAARAAGAWVGHPSRFAMLLVGVEIGPHTAEMVVDRTTTFGGLMRVMDVMLGLGFGRVDFVLSNRGGGAARRCSRSLTVSEAAHSEVAASITRNVPPPGSGDVPDEFHQAGLDLVIVVTPRGFFIGAWGGELPDGCGPREDRSQPTIPTTDSDPDAEGLLRCIRSIKESYPEETVLWLGADEQVSFEVFARTMVWVSGTEDEPLFTDILLPISAVRNGLALLPAAAQQVHE